MCNDPVQIFGRLAPQPLGKLQRKNWGWSISFFQIWFLGMLWSHSPWPIWNLHIFFYSEKVLYVLISGVVSIMGIMHFLFRYIHYSTGIHCIGNRKQNSSVIQQLYTSLHGKRSSCISSLPNEIQVSNRIFFCKDLFSVNHCWKLDIGDLNHVIDCKAPLRDFFWQGLFFCDFD